jgi:hypothetical protein
MNIRYTLAAVAAASLVLGGGSIALATPDTGPDSKACTNAKIAEGKALDALKTAEKTEKDAIKAAKDATSEGGTAITDNEQGDINPLHAEVLRLKEALDKAVADREKKCAEPVADKPDPKPAEPKPAEPKPAEPRSANPVRDDKNCKDFPSQAAAQTFFVANGPGDPHNLDLDDDGIACEVAEPAAHDGGQVRVVPNTSHGVETGGL